MRSSELAKQAGVTPRTLRHYRDVGLLPEPSRQENGYCDYKTSHLLRLLRIKNLRSLGFSLERISIILDELDDPSTMSAPSYLDELDHSLELQIEQLERQRLTITALKQKQVGADIPIDYADLMVQSLVQNYPKPLYGKERDALLMVDNLLDQTDKKSLLSFYHKLSDQDLMEHYHNLAVRCHELDDDTPEGDRDTIASDLVALFSMLDVGTQEPEEDASPGEADALLAQYQEEELNAAQKDLVRRVTEELLHSNAHART